MPLPQFKKSEIVVKKYIENTDYIEYLLNDENFNKLISKLDSVIESRDFNVFLFFSKFVWVIFILTFSLIFY